MIKPPVLAVTILKVTQQQQLEKPDLLAVEEPLEIRLGYGPANNRQQKRIAVTMRTPGNDFELALGFLFTEAIIKHANDVYQIKYCTDLNTQENLGNVVRVELKPEVSFDLEKLNRNFYTTSSCGVCGKDSIEAVKQACLINTKPKPVLAFDLVSTLVQKINNQQTIFKHTGGIHACGLFNFAGDLLLMREDVGRHNALDKLIGAQLSEADNNLNQGVLLLSGRASFELIQKAAMAGIPIVVAIGAPSSLALQTAKELGISLIGFLKENSYNLYC